MFTVRNENKHIFLPITSQIFVSCIERKPPLAICNTSSEKVVICEYLLSEECVLSFGSDVQTALGNATNAI